MRGQKIKLQWAFGSHIWGKKKSASQRYAQKSVDSLLAHCQVVVHHNHNLLVRDAILVDNLVGMARISLRAESTLNLISLMHIARSWKSPGEHAFGGGSELSEGWVKWI